MINDKDKQGQLLSESLMTAAVGVLGSMLIDEAAVGPMLMAVAEEDFQLPEQRTIFRCISQLYGQGQPVDAITVSEALGGKYNDLMARYIEVTPTSANADAYAEALKKTSRLHRLHQIGEQLAMAEDEDTCRAAIDQANLLFCERSGIRRVTLQEAFRAFFKRRDGGKPPDFLKLGFPDLDQQLHAGPGDMVVIGGYPSAGKTAFALQVAFHLAKNGKRVGFFSYETDADKLYDRTVACQTHTSFKRILGNALQQEDYGRIKDLRQHLTTPVMDLIEASGMTVGSIGSYAMAHHYDVIMIDYLQKIPAVRAGRYMSDFEKVSQVSNDLQQLGRTTKKTVVALSQLSRPDKKKDGSTPPPTLSSLRQSGQIEQDADVVLLLYKEYQDFAYSRRVLDLAKNKDGEAGLGLLLNFDGDKQRFSKSVSQPLPTAHKKEADPQQNLFRPVRSYEPSPFDQMGQAGQGVTAHG